MSTQLILDRSWEKWKNWITLCNQIFVFRKLVFLVQHSRKWRVQPCFGRLDPRWSLFSIWWHPRHTGLRTHTGPADQSNIKDHLNTMLTPITVRSYVYVLFASYLCLHHEGPVHSQVVNNPINVHHVFPFNLEDQTINGDEGACAPHTRTERMKWRQTETGRIWEGKKGWNWFSLWISETVVSKWIPKYWFISSDLQWTTVGECLEYWFMCSLTKCLKLMRSSVVSGTPWSGHAVKWKWRTDRTSAVLTCRGEYCEYERSGRDGLQFPGSQGKWTKDCFHINLLQ